MHIQEEGLEKLKVLFKEKYNRDLEGKGMGQFHSDFKCENKDFEAKYSEELIAVGKKCYVDKLFCVKKGADMKNLKPEDVYYDYHIRLKGVNTQAIDKVVNDQFAGDYMQLYKNFYDGKS